MTLQEHTHHWKYENHEFQATTVTDWSVKTNVSGAFATTTIATDILIRTDQDITLRFNSSTGCTFTLTAAESPLNFNSLRVSDIFITTSTTSNIKIFMTGR